MDITAREVAKQKQISIFLCYAHEDEWLLNELKNHLHALQREGLIKLSYDRDILAGSEPKPEIKNLIDSAQIILLLISSDFMASDHIYDNEMQPAMKRHERGETTVIPIILRDVHWHVGRLGKLKALPTDGKPVLSREWENRDVAFRTIVRGIQDVIEARLTGRQPQAKATEVERHFKARQRVGASSNLHPLRAEKPRSLTWQRWVICVVAVVCVASLSLYSFHPLFLFPAPPAPTSMTHTITTAIPVSPTALTTLRATSTQMPTGTTDSWVPSGWQLVSDTEFSPAHLNGSGWVSATGCNLKAFNDYEETALGGNTCNYGDESNPHDFPDVAYSVSMSITKGDRAGIILHLRDNTYYAFDITTSGKYFFMKHDGTDDLTIRSGYSQFINLAGQENNLAVLALNNSYSFWVNKHQVLASTQDLTYPNGTIGTDIDDTNSNADGAIFRDVQVWIPSQ